MASELSQAERTARETAAKAAGFGEPKMRRAWQAGRDYGRERERALKTAIERAEKLCVPNSSPKRSYLEIRRILRSALAASQPEVLSERSDTEPGEPEGQREPDRQGEMLPSATLAVQYGAAKPGSSQPMSAERRAEYGKRIKDSTKGGGGSKAAEIFVRDNAQSDHGPGDRKHRELRGFDAGDEQDWIDARRALEAALFPGDEPTGVGSNKNDPTGPARELGPTVGREDR